MARQNPADAGANCLYQLATAIYMQVGRNGLETKFFLSALFTFPVAYFMSLCKEWHVLGTLVCAYVVFMSCWGVVLGLIDTLELEPSNWQDEAWWRALDGWQFEHEVGEVFKRCGYKVQVTRGSGDGGVDIIMYKDNLKYIVQCKHYKKRLGPEAVRSLYGVKEKFGADRLVMVASSGLSPASQEFVNSYKEVYKAYDLKDIMYLANKPTNRD